MLFVALIIGVFLFVFFISLYFKEVFNNKSKVSDEDEDIEILDI